MPKVYLAGPIAGLSYDNCTNWRNYTIEVLSKWGITGVSPMRDKAIKITEIVDDIYPILCHPRSLVTRDHFDVRTCNVMLVNLLGAKKVSIGTMVEYGWADAYRKPIITIIEKEGNIHEHPFIQELTGFRVDNLDSGLAVVKSILCP